MSPDTTDPTVLADRYIDAYNAVDLDAVGALLADDVRIIHHNRGIDLTGRAAAVELYAGYGAAFPDRGFSDRRSIVVSNSRVIIEHTWGGTAAADVPGWAASGEKVRLELATFLTFRDGQLVEYHDYG